MPQASSGGRLPRAAAASPRPEGRKGKRWFSFGRRNRRKQGLPTNPSPADTRTQRFIASAKRFLVGLCVLCGAAFTVFVAQYVIRSSAYFALRSIRVSPLQHISPPALTARIAVPLGANVFTLDRAAIRRRVLSDPWVKEARVRFELPATLVIDVVEHRAAFVAPLGGLYLIDEEGRPFKRAETAEAAGLTVLTGLDRNRLTQKPEQLRETIRGAQQLRSAWQQSQSEPLGEINWDDAAGFTVYSRTGNLAVRLGLLDESLPLRLQRLAQIRTTLAGESLQPRMVYLDNRARPDRVTVRVAPFSPPRAEQRAD